MIEEHISDIVIGLVLFGLTWSFRNWASTLKETTKDILDMLKGLSREFHDHTIKTEKRVSTMEEKVRNLEKR